MTFNKITSESLKLIFSALIMIILSGGDSRSQIDSAAIAILDKMSDNITDLESCRISIYMEYDQYDEKLGLVKHSDISDVYLKAPDKMLVKKKGDGGMKNIYYNGKDITVYLENTRMYASAPAPPTIMETIDSVHNSLGIDFPAADFFYQDFTDNLIENSDIISYLGLTDVSGKECFHIAGTNDDQTFQFWVSNDANYLPLKLVIVYTDKQYKPQFEAVYSEWELNPVLPDSLFEFTAPEDAVRIKILK